MTTRQHKHNYGIQLGRVKDGKIQVFFVARRGKVAVAYARELEQPKKATEPRVTVWEGMGGDFDPSAVDPTLWLDESEATLLAKGLVGEVTVPVVSEDEKLIESMKGHMQQLEKANQTLQKQLLLEVESRRIIVEAQIVKRMQEDPTCISGPQPGA
jgi:hypothetical protein